MFDHLYVYECWYMSVCATFQFIHSIFIKQLWLFCCPAATATAMATTVALVVNDNNNNNGKNYEWVCLLFSYGDMLDNIIHLTLMTLGVFILWNLSRFTLKCFFFVVLLLFCTFRTCAHKNKDEKRNRWTNDDIFFLHFMYVR